MFVFLSIFAFLLRETFSDPCYNFTTYSSRENALSCIRSVGFNEARYKSTIDSFFSGEAYLKNFYIYLEHYKDTGPPYDLQVDLYQNFLSIYHTHHLNDFDAQIAIVNEFAKLHDYHTTYYLDPGLQSVTFFHPISLESYLKQGKQSVRIRFNPHTRQYFSLYNSTYPNAKIDFESLEGMDVILIDGVDPMTHLTKISESYRLSKNFNTNFNQLVMGGNNGLKSTWFRRTAQDFVKDYPKAPIKYTLLVNGSLVNYTVEFFVCCYDSKNKRCHEIGSSSEFQQFVKTGDIVTFENQIVEETKIAKDFILASNGSSGMYDSNTWELVCGDYYFNVFEKKDQADPKNKYAIFQLLSFLFTGYTGEDKVKLESCFDKIGKRNYAKLILDLRYNGGGDFSNILTLLMSFTKTNFPKGNDIIGPLLVTSSTDEGLRSTDPNGIFSGMGITMWNNLSDVTFRDYGGNITYPAYAKIDFDTPQETYVDFKKTTDFKGIEPENLYIVTNGACGGACGIFTHYMRATESAVVIALGGLKDNPMKMDCGSYDGSSVIRVMNNTLSFSWMALFPPDPKFSIWDKSVGRNTYETQLLGFTLEATDYRIHDWTALSYENNLTVFSDLIEPYFSKCVKWNIKINETDDTCQGPIEHGIYGRPCDSDSHSYDLEAPCVVKRCETGYFLNKDKTSCISLVGWTKEKVWNGLLNPMSICDPVCEHGGVCKFGDQQPNFCNCSGTGYHINDGDETCHYPECTDDTCERGRCYYENMYYRKCDCTGTNYTGYKCQTPYCEKECYHGNCTAGQAGEPNYCVCIETHGYAWGKDNLGNCSIPLCYPTCVHGECFSPGENKRHECNCSETWEGSRCDEAICDPKCTGPHVYCNDNHECECAKSPSGTYWWKDYEPGKGCQTAVCTPGCSKFGKCEQKSLGSDETHCRCFGTVESGYFTGPTCQPNCYLRTLNHVDCYQGYCDGYNPEPGIDSTWLPECVCNNGWKTELTGCNHHDCSMLDECHGRGECTGPAECDCYVGATGSDCSEDSGSFWTSWWAEVLYTLTGLVFFGVIICCVALCAACCFCCLSLCCFPLCFVYFVIIEPLESKSTRTKLNIDFDENMEEYVAESFRKKKKEEGVLGSDLQERFLMDETDEEEEERMNDHLADTDEDVPTDEDGLPGDGEVGFLEESAADEMYKL